MAYLIAVMCVIGIATGQILFKLSALSLKRTGSYLHPTTAVTIFSALVLYGVTTVAWIWVLQKVDLGRIYPLMALAFLLVPIASHFILEEQFTPQYFIGVLIIMIGIVISMRT